MKTKIKRHSRAVISVILAISMLISCMMVGLIATDAAKVTSEAVGGSWIAFKRLYFGVPTSWSGSFSHLYAASRQTNGYCVIIGELTEQLSGSRIYGTTTGQNIDHSSWGTEYLYIFASDTSYTVGTGYSNPTVKNNYATTTSTSSDYINITNLNNTNNSYFIYPKSDSTDCGIGSEYTNYDNFGYLDGSASPHFRQTVSSSAGGSSTISGYRVKNEETSFEATSATNSYIDAFVGSKVTITATPNSGYELDGFYSDSSYTSKITTGVSGNTYSYTITSTTAKTTYVKYKSSITTLTTPTIAFENSGAVNSGDNAILTVTNHSSYPAAANISYELYKNSTKLTTGYSYNDGVFTIPSFTYSNGDSYTVKAIAGNTTNYADSALSSAATLTVYEPMFALIGDVSTDEIENIVNADESHASTKAAGWESDTDMGDDSVHYNSTVAINKSISPGVYQIRFKTKNPGWKIDISLYQKGVGSGEHGQRSFNIDGFVPTVGNDYVVPSAGKNNIEIIEGIGSLVFKPGVTYTITVDQVNGTMDISSDAADVFAIARYKTFNPTTGTWNTGTSNAPAAIGTATASPSAGQVPYNSTLTAQVATGADYSFDGWYSDADCTTLVDSNATNTKTISTDTTYYALFKQNEPTPVALTLNTVGNGSVSSISGTHSGSAPDFTVYPGATVTFTAAPQATYELKSVTATNGSVSINGNRVTISNITAASTVTVTFTQVETYTVTVSADSATYGNVSGTYVNQSGVSTNFSNVGATAQTYTVKKGEVVTLTANPTSSGSFDGWSVTEGTYTRSKDTPLSAATLNIKPTSNLTIKGNFSQLVQSTFFVYFDSGMASGSETYYAYNMSTMTHNGITGVRMRTISLTANTTYKFHFGDENRTYYYDSSQTNLDASKEQWVRAYQGDKSNYNQYSFTPSETGDYTFYAYWGGQDGNYYYWFVDLVKGSGSSGSTDDTPSTANTEKLYVLDGIVTRYNSAIQTYGTNTFGDTKIISANSGVLSYNYYDATGSDQFVNTDNVNSEGQTMYHYDPASDLDFRVQTTINSGHQAIGVRAYVMNGMTYPAKKDKDGNYYADITLDADSGEGTLEVIPVYYNTLIPDSDYIKFYVDANTIGDKFGKTIGYSLWYANTSLHGMEGGYPGQPLLSDGNLLYGYFPKYYVDVNATTLPAQANRSLFAGVLLSNLAEHNETHKNVLTDWGCDTGNYQSFDYEDPVEIAKIADVDTIEFVAKYKELTTTHRYDSSYNARDLNGVTGKSWPASITRPNSASDALNNGFEYLTNIDGKRVNIFNETETLTGDPLYVVSVGNQKVTPNDWDTVWEVYTSSGTSIAAARPVDFINPSSALQSALSSYTNSPVLINYEGWLAGESNTGTRLDGRWLYSKSTDPTTLRLRVATKDASGNLTFHDDYLDWAEITDGHVNGDYETLATGVHATKLLELANRTTEVTAKINPVGYKVEGMYMLGASYSDTADNGYSSKITDYDNLDVSGTATSFVNSKDNRMVIVVEEIPSTDLMITHQMYGGPGAHNIKGFYYLRAELLDSSNAVVKTYNNSTTDTTAYTNKDIEIKNFTTDAAKGQGYKLKIYVRTAMSGSATFFQWYENNHNNGYNELDSDSARGSNSPVVYEKLVNVDDLYGNLESNLSIRNLDYYSDLQSADSVNINHLLLPATTQAGLNGATYNQVTVVDSSGNTISGGELAARAKTTTVDSSFITAENADANYQLKIQIWTIPDTPAFFDNFYMSDQETVMTSVSSGGILYTVGQTKTIGGVDYSMATIMVPIGYFFKTDVDEHDNVIEVFDTSKKDFNLYSSLKLEYKYSLRFDFQGYRNLYGNLGYDYSAQEFTVDELNNYFELSDSVTDTNGDTVTAYTFKDDDAREAFINLKAPYENTFMETVKWQTDMYEAGVHDEGMTANYNSTSHTWSFVVKLKKTDNRYAFATFRFPYQVQQYTDKHAAQTSTVTIDGQSVSAVLKLTNGEYIEKGGRSNTTTNYRTGYGNNYTISGNYVTAPQKIWNSTDSRWEYFDYWKVENVGDDKTGSAEYTRCYYPEFNLSLYQDSIISPVFSTAADGTSPSERAARDDSARKDTYSTNGRATITLMENSRMQWTAGRNGNTLSGNYVNGGDRIYTDFLVSYTYQDLQLNTDTTGMNAGVVIETVRDLDTENDEYVTKTQAEYKTSDDSSINKSAVEAYIKDGTGSSFLKTEFSVTTLDNKNRKNQYYSLPNISQTTHEETTRKNKLYRAYSYLKDSSGNVILISDPIYFTIYDIASIENMAAGASYGGVS